MWVKEKKVIVRSNRTTDLGGHGLLGGRNGGVDTSNTERLMQEVQELL